MDDNVGPMLRAFQEDPNAFRITGHHLRRSSSPNRKPWGAGDGFSMANHQHHERQQQQQQRSVSPGGAPFLSHQQVRQQATRSRSPQVVANGERRASPVIGTGARSQQQHDHRSGPMPVFNGSHVVASENHGSRNTAPQQQQQRVAPPATTAVPAEPAIEHVTLSPVGERSHSPTKMAQQPAERSASANRTIIGSRAAAIALAEAEATIEMVRGELEETQVKLEASQEENIALQRRLREAEADKVRFRKEFEEKLAAMQQHVEALQLLNAGAEVATDGLDSSSQASPNSLRSDSLSVRRPTREQQQDRAGGSAFQTPPLEDL